MFRDGLAPDSHNGVTRIICSALLVLAAMAAHGGAADRPDPEEWLREAEAAYDGVTSYTAVFHKRQRVAGKLLPEETILLKYRKPLSLYMRWIKAPYKGSELLYVAGWNQDRIRAHRGGILRFITRDLDPRNTRVLEVVFPKERAKDYDGRRFVVNQDVESKILVRIRVHDRDDQLVEEYGYENLELNAPLTDADFDPKNPEYHF